MQPSLVLVAGLVAGVAIGLHWPQIQTYLADLRAWLTPARDSADVVGASRLLYREALAGGMPADAARQHLKSVLDVAIRLDEPPSPSTP